MENDLGYFNIYRSEKKEVTHLTYVKLQEVIADVGGMANAFIFICFLLSYLTTERKKNEAIINKIFNIEIQEQSPFQDQKSLNILDLISKKRKPLMIEESKANENASQRNIAEKPIESEKKGNPEPQK